MFSIAEIKYTHLYPASTVFSSVKQDIGVKCYLQFSSLIIFFWIWLRKPLVFARQNGI